MIKVLSIKIQQYIPTHTCSNLNHLTLSSRMKTITIPKMDKTLSLVKMLTSKSIYTIIKQIKKNYHGNEDQQGLFTVVTWLGEKTRDYL